MKNIFQRGTEDHQKAYEKMPIIAAAKSFQSCLTLCDSLDCISPGSSVLGILQARILDGSHALLQEILLTQELNPGLLCCRQILYHLSHQRNSCRSSVSSVTQPCPTLCDPMNCSTPGFPVYYQLLELVQTHIHRVSDAIQQSHPLLSPSPPAFNLSWHQGLFQ